MAGLLALRLVVAFDAVSGLSSEHCWGLGSKEERRGPRGERDPREPGRAEGDKEEEEEAASSEETEAHEGPGPR